jgi:hypothetical protein
MVRLVIFQGPTSQTGIAMKQVFPLVTINDDPEKFLEIEELLKKGETCSPLPMWNSHDGEITKSRFFANIFSSQARIYHIWPAQIQWHLASKTLVVNSGDVVAGVNVAMSQCSDVIQRLGLVERNCESSLDALTKLQSDPTIQVGLITTSQLQQSGLTEILPKAENKINFTTFGLVASVASKDWDNGVWQTISLNKPEEDVRYFTVEFPFKKKGLTSEQVSVFQDFTNVNSFDDIPKILFAVKRESDTCGLLCECFGSAPALSVQGGVEDERLRFNDDVGGSEALYFGKVSDLLRTSEPELFSNDFIKHSGTKTFFFACPPLNLITHGFDANVLEPIVRATIGLYFKHYINSSLELNDAATIAFFERHKEDFLENGTDFITFHEVKVEALTTAES